MIILTIDVGGTHVKLLTTELEKKRSFDSGPNLTPEQMVAGIQELTTDLEFDVVSIGVPTPVVRGKIQQEPHNLGDGWVGFDFEKAFGKPTKLTNDAAMQAMGDYHGGRMLFLGLGTGLGSAMIVDGILQPMELAHLPYKNSKTFEDYLGVRGLERLGKKKWRTAVLDVVQRLSAALEAEYVILGGGNGRLVDDLPDNTTLGANSNAFLGGFRLWDQSIGTSSVRVGDVEKSRVIRRTSDDAQQITTLFVDIGGVLLTNGWDRKSRMLAAEKFDLDYAQIDERHQFTFDKYEVGRLSLDDYLDRVIFFEERPFSRKDFQDFVFAQSQKLPDMLEFMLEVKKLNHLHVIAVSNEGRELTEHRIKEFKLGQLFDCFMSSCFVHLRKPDVEMYRQAMDVAQAKPNQIAYIDDRSMFVDIARSLGIQGIRHRSCKETKHALLALGLKVDA
ncbi:ROK family protein [Blastopirellula sp. J2-11]|uniref:ROK family protein n=1 Tax=Blastopirellula sp. J2-11 TaxID=2943192 RepID=UPI0021C68051|nr:ROK family protein [Blastopirellula sp. J2-11]UUO04327.1 ROK family protein [Blastopirellula sp. J2-11]